MSGSTRFFERRATATPHLSTQNSDVASFVDVGGKGDCGFRASAVGIIEKSLLEKRNNPELGNLLKRHFELFPDQNPKLRLSTPVEVLNHLQNHPGMAAFVRTFAYTLRQIAVDEIVAHPHIYRGAFYGYGNEARPVSPAAMRQEFTMIDETAIAALAKATNIPIEVRVVEPNKRIPLRLVYGDARNTKPVVIQLENEHYTPRVLNTSRYQHVKALADRIPMTPQRMKIEDRELSEILVRIKAEDERLLAEFESSKAPLQAAVTAGEITREELIDIYISGIKTSDYLQNYTGYHYTAHGSEQFFNAIRDKDRSRTDVMQKEFKNHEQQITDDLVHAIARAISIGQIDSNAVFERLEQKQEKATFNQMFK